MRLAELDPKWMVGGTYLSLDELDRPQEHPVGEGPKPHTRHGMGVRFRCPVEGHTHVIVVWFENPIDGEPPLDPRFGGDGHGKRWRRQGTTFEDLSLSPSIHALDAVLDPATGEEVGKLTHWHGHVIRGEVSGV